FAPSKSAMNILAPELKVLMTILHSTSPINLDAPGRSGLEWAKPTNWLCGSGQSRARSRQAAGIELELDLFAPAPAILAGVLRAAGGSFNRKERAGGVGGCSRST